MKHDEFIGQVQNRARLSSRGDAERISRAVVETFSERLSGGEAKDMAAQLPREIGLHMIRDEQTAWEPERFDVDEFFRRVSERASVDLPAAVYQAKATVNVIEEAVSPGEMDQVRQQLGGEFQSLFEYEGASTS